MIAPLAGRRIGLLTASASRLGGGVFEAVVAQAGMVRELGGEAIVFALEDAQSDADRERFAPTAVRTFTVRGPGQIGFAPELVPALLDAELDCLHLHGIWMYPSRAGTVWATRSAKSYLISPHGMLDPWITARGRWKKTLARRGYERKSWRGAWALHALTAHEAADIARESGRTDSLVIANAGPPASDFDGEPRAPHIVFIGRIHAKKNLAALTEAWVAAALPEEARLIIAGWGAESDIAALRAAIARAGPGRGISFVGPQFGDDKQRLLREARFAVLPSLSEGLPMAMLEAWAQATPTIMSRACHLPEGFAAGAAIECGTDAASIAEALASALGLDQARWQAMAEAAHGLAAGPFASRTVASRWGLVYSAACAGDPPPGESGR